MNGLFLCRPLGSGSRRLCPEFVTGFELSAERDPTHPDTDFHQGRVARLVNQFTVGPRNSRLTHERRESDLGGFVQGTPAMIINWGVDVGLYRVSLPSGVHAKGQVM